MKPRGDTPVCVCDDNYCDEYADIPDSLIKGSNTIIQISTNKAGERFKPKFLHFKPTCPKIPPPSEPPKHQNPPLEFGCNENANDNTNYSKYSLHPLLLYFRTVNFKFQLIIKYF